ncbi:MAG: DNA polymerase I [Candidatus Omnitrophota bacterium]|nr:DNA polymerase I [Candidatus Omnitrophota bacterium]
MKKNQICLIDATAFCYRAFYALPSFSTSFGQPTGAVYGFVNILNKILKEKSPDYIAACFDVSRDTLRSRKFAQYKIQRPVMPEGLSSQIPLIKQILAAYGITILEKEGFEADDIIATIAKKARKDGLSVIIVSSDKDMLQLVDEDTIVFSPYKDEGVIYDSKKVYERYNVEAGKITDIIALMGDTADNIPGVSGIGEKTAIDLISSFGSLDKLLDNISCLKQEKLKKAIQDSQDQINLNRELVVLNNDVDIGFSLDKARVSKPDCDKLFQLFKQFEFKKFLKDLPRPMQKQCQNSIEEIKDEALEGLFPYGSELILAGAGLDNLVFCKEDKFFKLKAQGENLKEVLRDCRIKKTGHDLKKIKISLLKDKVQLYGFSFDTMLAAYLLNPSKSEYSLTELSWDYLGENMAIADIDNLNALSLIAQLKPKLEKELQEKSLLNLFTDVEMPLAEVLAQMEQNGIKLDCKVIEELSKSVEQRLVKLIEEIYELSGCQFNINSPKQLAQVLFEKLKLPIIKKAKTGPSTNEEVLKSLKSMHKLPLILLEYRQLMKLKNTYIDTLPSLANEETGLLHTSFNQAATETGRLSSSNPNLQNIPVKTEIGRNIRRAIIARDPQNCLVSFDYSQIELRILAHLSKDEDLISAFKEDKDIHKITASLVYHLKENDVTDEMRDTAKRVNFGIIYGLTSYGLSRDLDITLEEAQAFIDAYFLRYPKVKDYIEKQIKTATDLGFVTTILGRRRYLPEINNKNPAIRQFAERQAINTPIQGSASDMIKLAMIRIQKLLEEKNLKSKMILQVHDELVFDVPCFESEELIDLVKDRMENVLKLSVLVKVDVKKGRNWLEMEEVK